MTEAAPVQTPTKYSGPHSGYVAAPDLRVGELDNCNALEFYMIASDNTCLFDSKWAHSKGWVKYKMMASSPKGDNGEYSTNMEQEAIIRINHKNVIMTSEFKRGGVGKHLELNQLPLMDGKAFVNPYVGLNADKQLNSKVWTLDLHSE